MDAKKFKEIAKHRAEIAKILLESGLNELAIAEIRSLRSIAAEAYRKGIVTSEEFLEMDSIATSAAITVFPLDL